MRPFGPFERMPLSVSKDCGSRICAAVRASRGPALQTHGTVLHALTAAWANAIGYDGLGCRSARGPSVSTAL